MLWKSKSTHGPLQNYAKPISQPIWLGAAIEDPSGVFQIQVQLWGTLEKISTYISYHKYTHVHNRLFFMFLVSLALQAGISPVNLVKNMEKIPSQHVAPSNGNEGYSLRTRPRIATGGTYPGGGDGRIHNAIAFEDCTHSRSHEAKALIAIHIGIPIRRGRLVPIGLSRRCM